jgi:hypothetical protein
MLTYADVCGRMLGVAGDIAAETNGILISNSIGISP